MSEKHLTDMLRQLRLSGLAGSLEVRVQQAIASGLSHREFLELILQDELLVRSDRQTHYVSQFSRRASPGRLRLRI